ncbi:MAG TPA: hypothetical protein PK036_17410, partial [Geobacteraceae bacterium]|nr:hypothetical protein [Geobacteraceae bacterium]
MTGSVNENFTDELNRLEMFPADGEPSSLYFVEDKNKIEDPRIRITLEHAERYNANAVFFRLFPESSNRSPLPQIYIYHDTSLFLNEINYAEIH